MTLDVPARDEVATEQLADLRIGLGRCQCNGESQQQCDTGTEPEHYRGNCGVTHDTRIVGHDVMAASDELWQLARSARARPRTEGSATDRARDGRWCGLQPPAARWQPALRPSVLRLFRTSAAFPPVPMVRRALASVTLATIEE